MKFTFCAREVESTERLVNEHRPSGSTDDPGNRNTAAVSSELIPALAAAHLVDRIAAIELRPAFTQAEQRRIPGYKRQRSCLRIDAKLLDQSCARVRDTKRRWVRINFNTNFAAFDLLTSKRAAELGDRFSPVISYER